MTCRDTQKIVVLFSLNRKYSAMSLNPSMLVKKFSIPFLFLVAGLIMIFFGIKNNQDATFMMSSVMMFAAGILSLLYSTGRLTTKITFIVGIAAGIAAAFTLYMSYKSVSDTNTYNKNYMMCKSLAIQNLQDIRFVQKMYMEKHGKFIADWDELVEYTKNGTLPHVIAKGNVPDTFITPAERDYLYGKNVPIDNKMTELEAYRLSKWSSGPRYNRLFSEFRRDTVQVSIMESKFLSKSYQKARETAGFGKFHADSLPYIPFTGGKEKWKIETVDSIQMGEVTVPGLYINGTIPFAKIQGTKNESLSFGNLTSNDLTGSWEE